MRQLKITKAITNRENASLDKYLQEIGHEELISAEEEVELARRIKTGDRKALEKLTKANLRFVVSVAKQYQNQGLSLPDLINEGNIGLLKAAEKFDEDMQEYLAKKRPGDKVTVTYLRDKKKNTKSITLKNEQGNTQVVKKADLDVLGGNFRSITDAQKQQLNIGYGLEVLKVNSGKLKNAGITKGFIIQRVNDNAVKTIEDLQNIVKDASTSKDPVLYIQGVYPTGKKAYFAVPLED